MYIYEISTLFRDLIAKTEINYADLSELSGISVGRLGMIFGNRDDLGDSKYPYPEECATLCDLFPVVDKALVMDAAYKFWDHQAAIAAVYDSTDTAADTSTLRPVRRLHAITPDLKISAVIWWGKGMGLSGDYGTTSVAFDQLRPREKKMVYQSYAEHKAKREEETRTAALAKTQARREKIKRVERESSERELFWERTWDLAMAET